MKIGPASNEEERKGSRDFTHPRSLERKAHARRRKEGKERTRHHDVINKKKKVKEMLYLMENH